MSIDRIFKLYEAVEQHDAAGITVDRLASGEFRATVYRATTVGVGPSQTAAYSAKGTRAQDVLDELSSLLFDRLEAMSEHAARTSQEIDRKLDALRGDP